MSPSPLVFWFRRDLRLHDQPALHHALRTATERGAPLLPVVVHDPAQTTALTPWGFARRGPHRAHWEAEAVEALHVALQGLGVPLTRLQGPTSTVLADWCRPQGATELWCEDIPCPEEEAQVQRLQQTGLTVHTTWISTLVAPESLPFAPEQVPDVFTAFRQKLEAAGVREAMPLPTVTTWPGGHAGQTATPAVHLSPGSEAVALAHLAAYCAGDHPHHYKATRNAPDTTLGTHASSRWSPWLATGALSARTAMAAIRQFETDHPASRDGTYWLWFELLWRDHFRWLHRKHGLALYRNRGLSAAPLSLPPATVQARHLAQWQTGRTGQPLVDAGMRELAATGWLSNRLRQIVASFWVNELQGDWRAGAAWFEHMLIDHDPCSNQGNWLYIAGRGTDPRGGRRFNPDKQTAEHDPHGHYRRRWGTA